jgi:CheY-like chemotaxis protein
MIQPPTKPQVATYNPKSSGKRTGKILVVDDTEVVAQLVSDYLKSMGYETLIAYDGGEAVSVAKKEHPQIILMDVMMPIMDGLEATRKIRADVSLRDIPVIGLTALAMPSDREQCLAVGMNDHLSKPIQMQELVRIIERYLQKEKP